MKRNSLVLLHLSTKWVIPGAGKKTIKLISHKELNELKDGVELISSMGQVAVKGKDELDLGTSICGKSRYGFLNK